MPKKDPQRWNEVIIDSPYGKLTKRDVYEYFRTAKVQQAIRDAAGNRETVIRQSFSPDRTVLRRKDPKGKFIRVNKKSRFEKLIESRATEFHPTFGKKTEKVVVDIDPNDAPWRTVLRTTDTVAKALGSHGDIGDVNIRFSGRRGFYVDGSLVQPMGIDRARRLAQRVLHNTQLGPDITLGVSKPGQIRLDTTPMKVRGSVKAPYSLDARTGLVAAPVKLEELPNVKKTDFTVDKILKKLREKQAVATVSEAVRDDIGAQRIDWDASFPPEPARNLTVSTDSRNYGSDYDLATQQSGVNREPRLPQDYQLHDMVMRGLPPIQREVNPQPLPSTKEAKKKEFAPGIPAPRKTHKLPTVKKPEPEWMLAVQEHKAKRAGKHFDLRLVQPLSDRAHSWALPKARLPEKKDKMLLAVQQPTHKRDYALHFTGTLPEGYGAGTVTMPIKEKVKVTKMDNDVVKFERPSGEHYTMFRTKGDKWGIKVAFNFQRD